MINYSLTCSLKQAKGKLTYTQYTFLPVLLFIVYCCIVFMDFFFSFCCIGSSLLHADFLQLRQAGATLRCGARASHCGGFSCCRAWALGAGFSSCSTRAQQLWLTGSEVVVHGLQNASSGVVTHRLSCSMACGIFPDEGLNPCPLQ